MLTPGEVDYLNKIPCGKLVKVYPYNGKVENVVDEIVTSIRQIFPFLRIRHMSASALRISGQNDVDIYIFSDQKDFEKYLPKLTKLFGEALQRHETFCEWKFQKDDFDVELYLTEEDSDTMQNHIRVFEILNSDSVLLKEYEDLKSSMDGKSFRVYQKEKYKFYHKILDK